MEAGDDEDGGFRREKMVVFTGKMAVFTENQWDLLETECFLMGNPKNMELIEMGEVHGYFFEEIHNPLSEWCYTMGLAWKIGRISWNMDGI